MRDEAKLVREPATPEELSAAHNILRSDPQRYLRIVNEWIREEPANPHAYFDRHFALMNLGEPRQALDDLNRAIELESTSDPMSLMSRALVYRHLGEYEKALEDFDRAEAIDPGDWEKDIVFGLLFQADTHARLGNETAALACCARLPDDFWTAGIYGAPGGDKADVADKLRVRASEAGRKQRQTD
jgi:tetratricopeptide (TPR) repeat protein